MAEVQPPRDPSYYPPEVREFLESIADRELRADLDALREERDRWEAKAQMFRDYADSADRGEEETQARAEALEEVVGRVREWAEGGHPTTGERGIGRYALDELLSLLPPENS